MKYNQLTKAVSIVLASTMATSAFAGVASTADKTATVAGKLGDSIYSSLTGRAINQTPVNHPVSMYNYTQASSAYEDAYFNGDLLVADAKNQGQVSYNATIGADYDKVSSSPDANTKYQLGAKGNIQRSGVKDADTQESWNLNGSITHDRYFNPATSKLFWYGKGSLEAKNEVKGSDYAGIDDPRINITGGVGYGRVVNVTPLAKAMRVVESLIHAGIIKGTPSAATYDNIAQIIAKENEYKSKHGAADYQQMWVRDVERAIGKNLGASGAIKVYNVLNDNKITTRRYGWDVRAGVGVVATDFDGTTGKPLLEVAGNYYYPISNRTQFSNEARFNTKLDDDNNTYNFKNSMSLTYEVSDRIDWINTWDSYYTNVDTKNGDVDYIKNVLASTYRYYISNSISTDATLSYANEDSNGVKDDSTNFTMKVNYRLK